MHYQPRCVHKKVGVEVCISKACQVKNCFICIECKRFHKNCQFIDYKKFIHQIHKRQGLVKQQFLAFQQRVENTFTALIKALKNQFITFRQQFERFNAPSQILELYDKIKFNEQQKLTGEKIAALLKLQIPRMQKYRIRDQIEMKRIQKNIFAAHSYVIKTLFPYYTLNQKFQEIEYQTPQINELRQIQKKYMDRFQLKQGLLKGDLKVFQNVFGTRMYNLQMIFKASENEFSCKRFHEVCDGKRNTLVIAKTEYGKTLGMWCPFLWSSPEKWTYLQQHHGAFLFSMQKQLLGMKFEPVKEEFAIGMHKDYGPIFGDDFAIYDKANHSKGCWSNFPDVYNYKKNPLKHTASTVNAFVGVKDHFEKFNLTQWQVYKVNLNRTQDLDASWMKIYNQI